jgi:dethiobiotin synthetase
MIDDRVMRLGVTGTDTGIGKTVVTGALAARARQLGLAVAAMKPVESGIDDRLINDGGPKSDAERLQLATGGTDALTLIRPYVLTEPLTPMVAAKRADIEIDLAVLDAACQTLAEERDVLFIEGAGGLLSPITPTHSFLELCVRWRCRLIIVAGNRLGVLNHVLLTVRAAEAAQVPIHAIILTQHTQQDAGIAEATNYDTLVTMLPRYPVFRFPWVDRTDDVSALAAAAEGSGLDVLLTSRPTPPRVDVLPPLTA